MKIEELSPNEKAAVADYLIRKIYSTAKDGAGFCGKVEQSKQLAKLRQAVKRLSDFLEMAGENRRDL